jgi:hypothetical protein
VDQASMFDVTESQASPAYRTKTGDLKVSVKKAVAWYAIEHGLRLTAASAYPIIYFLDHEGYEVTATIDGITAEYKEFKRTTHNKRKASA